ncbi:MAG: HigA family addiction module antitoxin [Gammaproteobacteria bacterium]
MAMGMTPPHPGDFLRMEVLEPHQLNVTQAAELLGVRRATLSDLLNGNAALSPEMALRWDKAFGVSMEMMLRMQAAYDAAQMRQLAGSVKVKRYEPA